MLTAFKALWEAVSWGLKGVLGLLRQRGSFPLDWDVNRAVGRAVRETLTGAVDWSVYGATDWVVRRDVNWAVWRAVYDAEAEAVIEAVDRAVWNDPEHPALADFLREVSPEARVA